MAAEEIGAGEADIGADIEKEEWAAGIGCVIIAAKHAEKGFETLEIAQGEGDRAGRCTHGKRFRCAVARQPKEEFQRVGDDPPGAQQADPVIAIA